MVAFPAISGVTAAAVKPPEKASNVTGRPVSSVPKYVIWSAIRPWVARRAINRGTVTVVDSRATPRRGITAE